MSNSERLVSWKRIARYLDRGERTVRRWSTQDGMPVHHVSERPNSSVYALTSEIDSWLQQRQLHPTKKLNTTRPVLALLPVENLGNPESIDAIVDGLTEETISALGQIKELGVIARTSIMAYKHTSQSITDIGRALSCDYVIEGSMRVEGNIARITMQLISVVDNTHAWAENYQHSLDSPMALQRDIARQVANDIGIILVGDRLPSSAESNNLISLGSEEYFRGRYFLNQLSATGLRKSISAFDRAIVLDPEFGPAYGGKAEALQLLTNFSHTAPAEVMPEAMQAVTRAVALTPNSAEVFASLGHIHATYSHQWKASEHAFQQSLALNPNLVTAHQWYAETLASLGRFDDALYHSREAHRLDPLSVGIECTEGHVLWLARRYDELLIAMERVLSKEPNFPLAHILKFCAQFEQGLYPEALATCEVALDATGESIPFALLAKLAIGAQGEQQQIIEFMGMMKQQAQDVFISRFYFGMCETVLGNTDAAIDNFDKACDEGVWHVTMLSQCAMYDGLRQSTRFDELLKKIGLYESRYLNKD